MNEREREIVPWHCYFKDTDATGNRNGGLMGWRLRGEDLHVF